MKRAEIVSILLKRAATHDSPRLAMLAAMLATDAVDEPLSETDAITIMEAAGLAIKKLSSYAQHWEETLKEGDKEMRGHVFANSAATCRDLARILTVAADVLSGTKAAPAARARKAA